MKTKQKTKSKAENSACPVRKSPDVLEFPHPRDRLARRARFEISDRQAQQMPEQPLPEFHIDAICRVRQRVGAQILQHDVEQSDQHEPGDKHVQRRVALVREHLVDDDLEEERASPARISARKARQAAHAPSGLR